MARISTVGPDRGAADTVRDVRGFAMKFYTNEGNNDWVFNDIVCFEEDNMPPSCLCLRLTTPAYFLCPRSDQILVYESLPQAEPPNELT